MLRKFISLICISLGIIMLIYPSIKDFYERQQQKNIMKQWENNLKLIEELEEEENSTDETIMQKNTTAQPIEIATRPAINTQANNNAEISKAKQKAAQEYKKKYVEGVLIIDKIKLKLPILNGATKKNLQMSVASFENTAKAGEVGNYAIAGHRNRAFGKNFNRLDELKLGDLIKVEANKGNYKYEVTEKKLVLPEDVTVLMGNGKDCEITLITCHPIRNPTHRLVIKGKIIKE